MKAGGGPTTWQHARDTPTEMHDRAGEQGFQYPMFRPAGKLINGEAEFLEGDLEGNESGPGTGFTANSYDEWGNTNRPLGDYTKKAYFVNPKDRLFHRSQGDGEPRETPDQGWDRKLDESLSSGLFDDIELNGVQRPILLSDSGEIPNTFTGSVTMQSPGAVLNGHHRLAAAAEINPNMEVPVIYRDDVPGSEYTHSKPRGERPPRF